MITRTNERNTDKKAAKKNTVIEYTQMTHGDWYYYKYNKYRRWLRMVYINLEIIL